MSKIENKDLIMLGIIFGIAFFFIGAVISNVFPSSETNLLSYKLSACIKIIGLGVLTSSMVIGGIIIKDIDKNLRTLLLILGLILLIIYTIGAQSLQWNVPTSGIFSGSDAFENRPTGYGVPGFEVVFVIIALAITLIIAKKKRLGK